MDTNERALMEAVDVIAEMAARVKRNGPERYYAGEKLSYALFRAAEVLAIVGTERQIVLEEADRGFEHGLSLAGRPGWRRLPRTLIEVTPASEDGERSR
jgi:hypothetical protein